jgi:hypothetical protein
MRRNPAFDLFEEICVELSGQDEAVLADDDFSPETLEGVKRWSKQTVANPAIRKALDYLRRHFEARGSVLPFTYDLATGRATATNREYVDFVADSRNQRSIPKESRGFEVATSEHIARRLTGILRRVGSPRTKHAMRTEFSVYLATEFGFEKRVLVGNDKDGGFDILWFPPLGAFPFRAMVSIQCKNSPYNRDEGYKSVGRAKQSLSRHSHARAEETHLHCVLYNDYIDEGVVDNARHAGFVPLGLSDLAPLETPISLAQL